MSAITEIELLCWKTASGKDIQAIQSFINGAVVIELEQDIKISTAAIRKAHKIKLPDTIIAATALVYNLTLLTRNTSDFKDIKGISLHNPFDQDFKLLSTKWEYQGALLTVITGLKPTVGLGVCFSDFD